MADRPCKCDRFRPGEPFDVKLDCRLCWHFAHTQEYRTFWGGDMGVIPVAFIISRKAPDRVPATPRIAPTIVAPPRKFGSCVHWGEATGEELACPSCRGTVMLKVFGCAKHGKCTHERKLAGVMGCNANRAGPACPDYEEKR